tara:strand:- start:5920 stop:6519 length:600 start_codon:yes stop_codon:yes gene_type:complete
MKTISRRKKRKDVIAYLFWEANRIVDHATLRYYARKITATRQPYMITVSDNIVDFINVDLVPGVGDNLILPTAFNSWTYHINNHIYFFVAEGDIVLKDEGAKDVATAPFMVRGLRPEFVIVKDMTERAVAYVVDKAGDLDEFNEAVAYVEFRLVLSKGAHHGTSQMSDANAVFCSCVVGTGEYIMGGSELAEIAKALEV